jgi:hypothetical protein
MGFWPFNSKNSKDDIKVGDTVICIDDRRWNGCTNIELSHGTKYKITSISKSCHGISYDIGGRFNDRRHHTTCTKCNKDLSGQGIHWAATHRFRKQTTEESYESNAIAKEELNVKIKKAIKDEDYELARKLTTELEK